MGLRGEDLVDSVRSATGNSFEDENETEQCEWKTRYLAPEKPNEGVWVHSEDKKYIHAYSSTLVVQIHYDI
jgi:hypothetical protein